MGQAIARLDDKNDVNMAYAILHLPTAKSKNDVNKIFDDAKTNGAASPFIDRDKTVRLIKSGLQVVLKNKEIGEDAAAVVDSINDYTKKLEGGKRDVEMTSLSKEAAIAMMYGGLQEVRPDIREQALRQIAKDSGLDYDKILSEVIENRTTNIGVEKSANGDSVATDLKKNRQPSSNSD